MDNAQRRRRDTGSENIKLSAKHTQTDCHKAHKKYTRKAHKAHKAYAQHTQGIHKAHKKHGALTPRARVHHPNIQPHPTPQHEKWKKNLQQQTTNGKRTYSNKQLQCATYVADTLRSLFFRRWRCNKHHTHTGTVEHSHASLVTSPNRRCRSKRT